MDRWPRRCDPGGNDAGGHCGDDADTDRDGGAGDEAADPNTGGHETRNAKSEGDDNGQRGARDRAEHCGDDGLDEQRGHHRCARHSVAPSTPSSFVRWATVRVVATATSTTVSTFGHAVMNAASELRPMTPGPTMPTTRESGCARKRAPTPG
ncbi:MAG: hypothetical protein QOH54_4583, partial [Mycobacterium sp.]|nr:hypothetical protein [Mycobacterium sp.]MDT5285673.1 hypothetical protein [Mycobacterium sp.]